MSKEKKVHAQVVDAASEPTPVLTPPTAPSLSVVPPAPAPERMSEVDKLNLDLIRTKRQTALAEAKTALANNEKAELEYKYLVLQIYMKYGLTADDAISETGEIVRGGARASQKPQVQ
jgi:hypothetical protein